MRRTANGRFSVLSAQLARKLVGMLAVKLVQPPRSVGLEPYPVATALGPRNRDPAHRWLRETVEEATRRSTRSRV